MPSAHELHLEVRVVERVRLVLRDDDVARLPAELGDQLGEIGGRLHRRARLVRLRSREEHAVRAGIDAHEDDRHAGVAARGGEARRAGDDVHRLVREGVGGDDAALQVDEDERGGRGIEHETWCRS